MSNDKEIARLWKLQTQVNRLVMDGKRPAKEFADLLQNLLEQPKSNIIPILRNSFNPVEFLGDGWSVVKEEMDGHSRELTELDLSKVELVTMLRGGELLIPGEEKLARLKASGKVRLDADVFMTLQHNKKLIPKSWKGKRIFFDGTILRAPGIGRRRGVLCLYWSFGTWRWGSSWLDLDWHEKEPSAVLAS